MLLDFVDITTGDQGEIKITVRNGKNGEGEVIWSLHGMILTPHFNLVSAEARVHEKNYKGIMGLADQVGDSLFIEDGVYTLWNHP